MFCRNGSKCFAKYLHCPTLWLALFSFAGCGGGGSVGGSGPTASITSVAVSCDTSSLQLSAVEQPTTQCTAIVTGAGSYSTGVNWTATVGTVSTNGLFSPTGITAAANVTVTATSQVDSSKSGSATIAISVTALTLKIIDLPTGIAADVTLTDPNGAATKVVSSETILALPGTYIGFAAPVTATTATYEASLPQQTTIVEDGSTPTMTIDYYDVVPSTTKVLDQTAMRSLTVSADGLTLAMSSASPVAQSLGDGDVVVVPPTAADGVARMGMLRKVVSVANSGSQVAVKTEKGTLAEAFQRARFQIQTQLQSNAIQSVHTGPGVIFHSGASIRRKSSEGPFASSSGSLSDPCGGFSLGVFDVNEPIDAGIVPGLTLSGSVEVCSGLNLAVDIIGTGFLNLVPTVNSFTATASMGTYSDLTLDGDFLSGSFDPGPITLGSLDFPPVEVPGLPVWVTPEVSVFVGANGSVYAGITTEATASGTFTGGVTYASGNWAPVPLTPSLQFAYKPPTLDAGLSAKAYAGVEFDLYVYDVIGPSFKPDGYLDLEANMNQNPWWTLTGGLEGPMSLNIGFLGENLASYDLGNMFDYSTVIASASAPFSSPIGVAQLSFSPTSIGPDGSATGIVTLTAAAPTGGLPVSLTSSNSTVLSVPAYVTVPAGSDTVTFSGTASPGVTDSSQVTITAAYGSSSQGATVTVNPVGITVSPLSAEVVVNGSQQFTTTVVGTTNTAVTWTVNGVIGGDSDVGTITAGGLYTAPAMVPTQATVSVTAATVLDSSLTATATVTIIASLPAGTMSTVVGGGYGCVQETDSIGDGCPNTQAQLVRPTDTAIDHVGDIYLVDEQANRIRLANLQTLPIVVDGVTIQPGTVASVVGNGTQGYSGDGGPATSAELNAPGDIFLDPSGNIFVSDSFNHVVRLVNMQTSPINYAGITIQPGDIATVAGGPTVCASATDNVGDGCPATQAQLNLPDGIALGPTRNLYIADFYGERIRVVDASTGVISTVAGDGFGGYAGDNGPAVEAEFLDPSDVAVDSNGNVFITDYYNNRVRMVNASTGVITTIAGTGTYGYSGDGGLAINAEVASPLSIITDKNGNVYFTDYSNQRIRVINMQVASIIVLGAPVQPGNIVTVAGNGSGGYSGDGGPATSATLNGPTGLSFDAFWNLYLADAYNAVIRKVTGP